MFGLLIATPTFWGNDGNESIWPFHKVKPPTGVAIFPLPIMVPSLQQDASCSAQFLQANRAKWCGLGWFVCATNLSIFQWLFQSMVSIFQWFMYFSCNLSMIRVIWFANNQDWHENNHMWWLPATLCRCFATRNLIGSSVKKVDAGGQTPAPVTQLQ